MVLFALIWSIWMAQRAYLHKSPQKKWFIGFYYTTRRTQPNVRIDTSTVLHWHYTRTYQQTCSLMKSYNNLKPKLLCHRKPRVVYESCLSLHYEDNASQKPNNQAHPGIFSWWECRIQKAIKLSQNNIQNNLKCKLTIAFLMIARTHGAIENDLSAGAQPYAEGKVSNHPRLKWCQFRTYDITEGSSLTIQTWLQNMHPTLRPVNNMYAVVVKPWNDNSRWHASSLQQYDDTSWTSRVIATHCIAHTPPVNPCFLLQELRFQGHQSSMISSLLWFTSPALYHAHTHEQWQNLSIQMPF